MYISTLIYSIYIHIHIYIYINIYIYTYTVYSSTEPISHPWQYLKYLNVPHAGPSELETIGKFSDCVKLDSYITLFDKSLKGGATLHLSWTTSPNLCALTLLFKCVAFSDAMFF